MAKAKQTRRSYVVDFTSTEIVITGIKGRHVRNSMATTQPPTFIPSLNTKRFSAQRNAQCYVLQL